MFVAGACDREGVSYQRVHVDDGSETVGVVDYLVHQTAPLHVHLGGRLSCLNEGINYTIVHAVNICLIFCIHVFHFGR